MNGYLLVAQWLTNCSTQTLQRFLTALRDGKLGELIRKKKRDSLPKNVTAGDKKSQRMVFLFLFVCSFIYLLFVNFFFIHMIKKPKQAGARSVCLHGCVGCHKKVWGADDASDVCDVCGPNRFDATGKPREYVVHFPLTERFTNFLRCDQYVKSVRWECDRPSGNTAYMSGLSFCSRPHTHYTIHGHSPSHIITTYYRCLRFCMVARVDGACLPDGQSDENWFTTVHRCSASVQQQQEGRTIVDAGRVDKFVPTSEHQI